MNVNLHCFLYLKQLSPFLTLSTACRVHKAQDGRASSLPHQEDLFVKSPPQDTRETNLSEASCVETTESFFPVRLTRTGVQCFHFFELQEDRTGVETLKMRPWTGSWRWIMLILFAWGTLLFYIGGHLVRDNDHPDHSSRELSKILAKLERLKQQNEDLRRMAESLR